MKYFYGRFKGEGARKLEIRISNVYTGIGRQFIQEKLNQNQDHFRRRPMFSNKQRIRSKIINDYHKRGITRYLMIFIKYFSEIY